MLVATMVAVAVAVAAVTVTAAARGAAVLRLVEPTLGAGALRVPAAWRRLDDEAPHANATLQLTFAVRLRNRDELQREFDARTDPTNADMYTRWLSRAELRARFGAADADVAAVTAYVRDTAAAVGGGAQHLRSLVHHADASFVVANVSVALAERLTAGCRFRVHEHAATRHRLTRCSRAYRLPRALAAAVDFVGGTVHLPRLTAPRATPAAAAALQRKRQVHPVIDPSALRQLYNVGTFRAKPARNNSQSIIQFLGQYADNADLKEFWTLFDSTRSDMPTYRGPDTGLSGVEASLDTQYIMAMGALVPTLFWSNPNTGNQEPFLNWLADLANTTAPPKVISVSYGDDEASATPAYLDRLNDAFMTQGLRGLSILFASGDSGVGGVAGDGGTCTRFGPDIPASLPAVTAVGGTELYDVVAGEEVCAGLSGGGFSTHFKRQPWQAGAVQHYLAVANHTGSLPAASYYNAEGRAYPDVSAMAMNFVVVVNLIPTPGVAGTSAAAPTFSGIVSLLNDARMQHSKRALGPLNPLLYKLAQTTPAAFKHIMSGSNPGCGTSGFSAEQASLWSPCSGLGAPNFKEMLPAVLALP